MDPASSRAQKFNVARLMGAAMQQFVSRILTTFASFLALACVFPHTANSATVFQQLSPTPTTYTFGVGNDYTVITFSAPADVTTVVRGGIGDGCQAADFAGFTGGVALMARGDCLFAVKVQNAVAAGAVAALIYNTPALDAVNVTFGEDAGPQAILAFFLRNGLGLELEGLSGIAVVRMFADEAAVTPTPLPAALPLFAGGLGALGLLGWRRKRRAAALAA